MNFFDRLKHLAGLCVHRALGSEIDVAVGMGGIVSVVHQLPVVANLTVITSNESERSENCALADGAIVGRGRLKRDKRGRKGVLRSVLRYFDSDCVDAVVAVPAEVPRDAGWLGVADGVGGLGHQDVVPRLVYAPRVLPPSPGRGRGGSD